MDFIEEEEINNITLKNKTYFSQAKINVLLKNHLKHDFLEDFKNNNLLNEIQTLTIESATPADKESTFRKRLLHDLSL